MAHFPLVQFLCRMRSFTSLNASLSGTSFSLDTLFIFSIISCIVSNQTHHLLLLLTTHHILHTLFQHIICFYQLFLFPFASSQLFDDRPLRQLLL
eukprot:487958_1